MVLVGSGLSLLSTALSIWGPDVSFLVRRPQWMSRVCPSLGAGRTWQQKFFLAGLGCHLSPPPCP